MKRTFNESLDCRAVNRRGFIGTALCACALTSRLEGLMMQFAPSLSKSLTKDERDSMTPAQVIEELKKGNERFRTGKAATRNYLAEQRFSAKGQYPAAVILGLAG